ncbi:uncharacterized protein LOC124543755 [Vanessa cardui]|uniref:uncharacterized protein LOC124543755 n=1 Tax=Vanessa cardui TaxID=171605 RepID=UPI001F1395FD|nr:uncharacterized protein LOC124543755 [Vanessa cardui]
MVPFITPLTQILPGDLKAQLMMEKGKVSELEMRLKAAELSRHVAKTLEKQYTSSIVLKPNSPSLSMSKGSPYKANDDSGYTDTSQDKSRESGNKDSFTGQKDNRDILDQIASLQAELVSLKHSFVSKVYINCINTIQYTLTFHCF